MKKYLITILNPKTGSNSLLVRDENNIDDCINRELKGYSNLHGAMTSRSDLDNVNYQQAGTTKEGEMLLFSILCYNEEEIIK